MTDERATEGHNVAEISKTIKRAAAVIIQLKGQRAEINSAITDQKNLVKALGVKASEFAIALRFMEMESDDTAQALDDLRVCFEALEIGAQSDFFPAAP